DLHYPLRRQRQMCIRDRFNTLIIKMLWKINDFKSVGYVLMFSFYFLGLIDLEKKEQKIALF
ncbi:hypothetical protein, partial [Aliivibrio salmonicida]|uniref:hypothetical protein n=1 Tax=Aliivibrio salmonicida TaxID=40269 RepID=UPI003D1098AE